MINTRSIVLVALTVLMAQIFCPGSTLALPTNLNRPPDFLTAKAYSLVPDGSTGSVDPQSMALGDFNGDGKVDIVSANYASPTITVLLASADGSFGLPTEYSVGLYPIAVLTGDLNGDGKLDLAVANYSGAPGLSILIGDGMGGFGSAKGFALLTNPLSLVAADFNHDGKTDLVATNFRSNNVSVLLGDGAGNFSSYGNFAAGLAPWAIATGDFNGDSEVDLAATNDETGNVSILLGNGKGGFGSPLPIFVGGKPRSILIRDLNGDGKSDIVVSTAESKNISVLLGNGTGNFSSPIVVASALAAYSLASGDFNGDGKLDLAVASGDGGALSILPGDGAGGFDQSNSFIVGSSPESLAVGDFNGDGRLDLAVGNHNVGYVWILPGRGDGSFLTAPGYDAAGPPTLAVTVSDFNGDGKADLATINYDSNIISVQLGDGHGGLGIAIGFPVESRPVSITTGDFNRDGKPDIVVSESGSAGISVLLGDGTGGFRSGFSGTFGIGVAPFVGVGDFNGDGKADVVFAFNDQVVGSNVISILFGDGDGNFSRRTGFNIETPPESAVVGDVNGDGKSDFAITSGSNVVIVFGNSTGELQVGATYPITSKTGMSTRLTSLALADINGDGKPDLIVSSELQSGAEQRLSVLLGDVGGTFKSPSIIDMDGKLGVVRDFNGDGKLDLATFGSVISIANGDGLGGAEQKTYFAAGSAPSAVAAEDFDGDGKLDLVATDFNANKIFILLNAFDSPAPASLQFSSSNFSVVEGDERATVTVTRTGDPSTTVSANYLVGDLSASQRSDYNFTSGHLSFGAGETSKTFTVVIVDDAYVENSETVSLSLGNLTGNVVLGSPGAAVLTIVDNDSGDTSKNPSDDVQFFVRQHYYDFLSRVPDQSGFDFWVGQITPCGSDQACLRQKRIDVSDAFFYELEYQQTGSYVYRLYRAAFGNNQPFPNKIPDPDHAGEEKKVMSYQAFVRDRARVIGGTNLAQSQFALANAFVQRTEFMARYGLGLDGPDFVDVLLATIKNDLGADITAQRGALINLYNNGGRGAVLYKLADDNVQTNPVDNRAFIDAEYNRAFVATQYFGYLRRDPDMAGFLFWLGQINRAPLRDVPKQHALVCSFITSAEYQLRFSSIVSHANRECPR
jgi:hypothetical protein